VLNRTAIEEMLARPLGTTSSLPNRAGLGRARSMSSWVKDYTESFWISNRFALVPRRSASARGGTGW
jgi:hypothetical protein